MNRLTRLLCAAVLLAPACALADDCPQYGGPNRDFVSREAGLLRRWPEGGPKLLWRISGLCGGNLKAGSFGSPVVAGGILYVGGISCSRTR